MDRFPALKGPLPACREGFPLPKDSSGLVKIPIGCRHPFDIWRTWGVVTGLSGPLVTGPEGVAPDTFGTGESMKKHVVRLVLCLAVILGLGAVSRAEDFSYPVGKVFCDGLSPAYFMGIRASEEEALTSIAMWTREYEEAGGDVSAGEDGFGKFGWTHDWRIVGVWVWPRDDRSKGHPCLESGHQGSTVECHYYTLRRDAPSQCGECAEKSGMYSKIADSLGRNDPSER
jgi:hypothetical protein